MEPLGRSFAAGAQAAASGYDAVSRRQAVQQTVFQQKITEAQSLVTDSLKSLQETVAKVGQRTGLYIGDIPILKI